MTLAGRLRRNLLALLLGTALLGGAALLGLAGLNHHFDAAHEHHEQLQSVYEIGHRAASVRLLLNVDAPDAAAIDAQLTAALRELDSLQQSTAPADGDTGRLIDEMSDTLRRCAEMIADGHTPYAASAAVNTTLNHVSTLAGDIKASIVRNRELATARLHTTMAVIGGLFALIIIVGIIAAIRLHRSVMKPLRLLEHAVGRLTRAQFSSRIPEHGDREFRTLIRHVNRMAGEIEQLHLSMQHEIDIKSRHLMRSEQLVSVGSLAAGVAHEINNPLGIIAGYAEKELRRLDRDTEGNDARRAVHDRQRKALGIICDEAFRCRDITRQLLDMARTGDGERDVVALSNVAHRAVQLVQALPIAAERTITVRIVDEAEHLRALGNRAQLLQVLLNILTNALEACEPGEGRVAMNLERRRTNVVVSVTDNGCGMDDETLARAFDPFYTDKPQRGLSGAGLGLWVAHSIVERHGGRLLAHRNGDGPGSTFIMELPAHVEQEATHHVSA